MELAFTERTKRYIFSFMITLMGRNLVEALVLSLFRCHAFQRCFTYHKKDPNSVIKRREGETCLAVLTKYRACEL